MRMNIKATDGIEQCQWSPRTGKFYLAVPEVNGSGGNHSSPVPCWRSTQYP